MEKFKYAKALLVVVFSCSVLFTGLQFLLHHHYHEGGPLQEYARFEAHKTRFYRDPRSWTSDRYYPVKSYVAGPELFMKDARLGGFVAAPSLVLLVLLMSRQGQALQNTLGDVDEGKDPGDHYW